MMSLKTGPEFEESPRPSVAACFIKAGDIAVRDGDKPVQGLEVCLACDMAVSAVIKKRDTRHLEGAQKIRGLWRLYPMTAEARHTLIVSGVNLRGQALRVHASNPSSAGDDGVKLMLSNLPLSVATSEVTRELDRLGVTRLSPIKYDFYREEGGGLTTYKTGRRFVFIKRPKTPLPNSTLISSWRVYLFYRGQPQDNRNSYDGPEENNPAPLGAYSTPTIPPVIISQAPVVEGTLDSDSQDEGNDGPEALGDLIQTLSSTALSPHLSTALEGDNMNQQWFNDSFEHMPSSLPSCAQVSRTSQEGEATAITPSQPSTPSLSSGANKPKAPLQQANMMQFVETNKTVAAKKKVPGTNNSMGTYVCSSPSRASSKRSLSGEVPSPMGKLHKRDQTSRENPNRDEAPVLAICPAVG